MTKDSKGMNKEKKQGSAKTTRLGEDKGLTPGQADFVKGIKQGLNPQRAAMQAFPNQSYGSASVTANRMLSNVRIMERLEKIDTELEETMLDVMRGSRVHYQRYKRAYDGELALKTASYIHDKRHGKAKQAIEVQSTAVSIKIDLSGKANAS